MYTSFKEIAMKINDIVKKKNLAEIVAMEGEWAYCHHNHLSRQMPVLRVLVQMEHLFPRMQISKISSGRTINWRR